MSENRQTKLAETALRIARGALGIILFLTGTSYLIIAIAIILSLPNRPDELGLIAVLAITMAAVIVASPPRRSSTEGSDKRNPRTPQT